jgi:crotonobetainyl-CoA:carnitine CoA-transferase CaiB-like acyl-CoA transferase
VNTLTGLLAGAGLEPGLAAWADLSGADPALPSSFRIGEAAQASIAALGLAAASLHAARGGPIQRVAVSMDDAAAEFHSERYLRVNDSPPADPWDAIAGAYPTRDGVVRLHTNFPHHRDGILALLGCANDRAAVAAALLQRDAIGFEMEATAAGLCVSAMRSFAEWDAHPQAQHLATTPLLAIERIGDAPPRPLPALARRPLEGFRVLDLTRVIAGPVAARGLAVHGAEVLHITGPHLPSIPTLVVDTGRGKRCATLDLRDAGEAARLDGLAAGADAFVQSYRAGSLAAKGFSAAALAERHPGIVVGELCAYGWGGPWAEKRGFDSLVQTSTGFNMAEAEAAGVAAPKVLPCQPLDHASGYLLALGVAAAWHRRAVEGGSWRVRVTLARTGLWLRGLGRIDGFGAVPHAPELVTEDGPFGPVRHLPHAARMSLTPAYWSRPAEPLGASLPAWA